MTDIDTIYEPDDDGYPPDDEKRRKQPGPVPRGGGARLLAKERQRKALELRKAGSTYTAIANALGYSDHTGARAAVIKAFDEIVKEPAIELQSIQYERLNHMLLVLWPKVQGGDERAIMTALSIMDKMDRLMGTEEPKKNQVDVNVAGAVLVIDGNKDEYIAQMRKMANAMEDEPMALPTGDTDYDIIDAEVVEKKPRARMLSKKKETLADVLDDDAASAIHKIMAPPNNEGE